MNMLKPSKKPALEEGKYYPFRISGSVVLPDGSECYILSDMNHVKHLLHKAYYSHYDFKHNQEIVCRIDKINCTGKIFIEPEHPVYQPGKSYSFEFSRYHEVINQEGVSETFAVLKNGFSQDIFVSSDEFEQTLRQGERIEATVERIKKGRVYISVGGHMNDYTGMEHSKKYHFTMAGEHATDFDYSYYRLIDSSGKEFRIRKKFYTKYGFRPGSPVSCMLMETNHEVFLEPVHPCYEPGFIYSFRITGEIFINEYPGRKKEAFLLKNPYGKDIVLKKEDIDDRYVQNGAARCTVLSIKKGQVFLAGRY
jgi:hypothetical protein